jgi:hypothetical protein
LFDEIIACFKLGNMRHAVAGQNITLNIDESGCTLEVSQKEKELYTMILHCVFCNFRPDISFDQKTQILGELSNFSQSLDGVLKFDFGPNLDFEKKSKGYDCGFVIRFADQDALEAYAVHPVHLDLGARLCDLLQGGADGLVVFDLKTPG